MSNSTIEYLNSEIDTLDIFCTKDPICTELEGIVSKDFGNIMQDYVITPDYIVCALLFNQNYPIRFVCLHMHDVNAKYVSDEINSYEASIYFTTIIGVAQYNYRYSYPSHIMKNCSKASSPDENEYTSWKILVSSLSFYNSIEVKERIGLYYFILDTSTYAIDDGHNLAIACSRILSYVQKFVWKVSGDIVCDTVFKFVKSPEKELLKDYSKWHIWKNSLFKQIVNQQNITQPGFLFLCREGQLFDHSFKFIQNYLDMCRKNKVSV